MSLRKAFVMVVALLALGAYVYFVELPRSQEEAAKKKLLTFDPDAVAEVVLTYPDREIRLQKDEAGHWRITQPVEVKADDTAVTNLVNAIADSEITRTLEEGEEGRAIYGLDEPVVTFSVSLKDGTTLPKVNIGKDTPVGFSVFVQKDGDEKILLTRQALRLGMTKEVKDLRDRTVVAFNTADVTGVEIKDANTDIVLRKADSDWTLQEPLVAKADTSQVQTFLSTLHGLRAQDFIEQPVLEMKEFGLDPPQLSVSLALGDEEPPSTLLVGGERTNEKGPAQRYVQRGGQETLFLVRNDVLTDLSKTVNDFRDKTIVSLAANQVKKIEVARQDGEDFTISRDPNGKWTIDVTQEGTLKEATLSQFVADAGDVRGFEIVADEPDDLGAYGLDKPLVTLTLFDENDRPLPALLVSKRVEEGTEKVFALSKGGKTVFALRDYVFERLNKKPTDFWEVPKKEGEAGSSDQGASEEKITQPANDEQGN